MSKTKALLIVIGIPVVVIAYFVIMLVFQIDWMAFLMIAAMVIYVIVLIGYLGYMIYQYLRGGI